jgi:NADH-quinone oxidoreductase subunit B
VLGRGQIPCHWRERGSIVPGEMSIFDVFTTKVTDAANWARKFSLFTYPFVTACCGMEFMSCFTPQHDIARFGAEFPRFSPRQADLMMVVGTITERQAPVLRRIYEQMCEPKWVIAFGVCASTGGFYQNYSTVPGADQIIPVDVYIPGCPPRPEQVFDAIVLLQQRIQRGEGHSQVAISTEGKVDVPLSRLSQERQSLINLPPSISPKI